MEIIIVKDDGTKDIFVKKEENTNLTNLECAIYEKLMLAQGRVVSIYNLKLAGWGSSQYVSNEAVRQVISRINKKTNNRITNVRNRGYVIKDRKD